MTRASLRLLHCADLHFHHARAEDALATARALSAAASATHADAVLIAGDLFDAATQPDAFVDAVAGAWAGLTAPLVAIPGNHDIRYGDRDGDAFGALFDRLGDGACALRAHAGAHALLLAGRLAVWGRGMPEHTPANDPLVGLAPAAGVADAWHVALAHGHLVEAAGLRASPIVLARHADALAAFDYLALGHEHDPYAGSFGGTRFAYSGSTARAIGSGTVAIVDLADGPHGGEVRVTSSQLREAAR